MPSLSVWAKAGAENAAIAADVIRSFFTVIILSKYRKTDSQSLGKKPVSLRRLIRRPDERGGCMMKIPIKKI
jgi:hypothetical protein